MSRLPRRPRLCLVLPLPAARPRNRRPLSSPARLIGPPPSPAVALWSCSPCRYRAVCHLFSFSSLPGPAPCRCRAACSCSCYAPVDVVPLSLPRSRCYVSADSYLGSRRSISRGSRALHLIHTCRVGMYAERRLQRYLEQDPRGLVPRRLVNLQDTHGLPEIEQLRSSRRPSGHRPPLGKSASPISYTLTGHPTIRIPI